MDSKILLESGTNELEILEFVVGENHYGINVAKIREILPYKRPTPIPNSHPCVEGIYMPRDTIITVIDLNKSLAVPYVTNEESDMFVVTNFNKLNVAFHVQTVCGIHRVSWADISKPDESINDAGRSVATGFLKINGKLIVVNLLVPQAGGNLTVKNGKGAERAAQSKPRCFTIAFLRGPDFCKSCVLLRRSENILPLIAAEITINKRCLRPTDQLYVRADLHVADGAENGIL